MSDDKKPVRQSPSPETLVAPGDYKAQRQLDDRLVDTAQGTDNVSRHLESDKVAAYQPSRE